MWTCSIRSVLKDHLRTYEPGRYWRNMVTFSSLPRAIYECLCMWVNQTTVIFIYRKNETFIWKNQVLDGDYKSDVGPCCLQRLICKVLEDIAALLEAPFLFAVLERLLFYSKIPRSWNWKWYNSPLAITASKVLSSAP